VSDEDEDADSEGKSESVNDKGSKIPKSTGEKGEDTMLTENAQGEEEEPEYYEEVSGVFRPEVDQILWKKDVIEADVKKTQYLVKFKDYSYLHCKWIDEAELYANNKNAKNKINRFNKNFEKKLLELVRFCAPSPPFFRSFCLFFLINRNHNCFLGYFRMTLTLQWTISTLIQVILK